MSRHFWVLIAVVGTFGMGCSTAQDAEPPLLTPPVSEMGFQVATPKWTVEPGEEKSMCLYTTLPNNETVFSNHFTIQMRPGSHHLLVYRDISDLLPGSPAFVEGFRVCDMETALPINGSQTEFQDSVLPAGVGAEFAANMKIIIETQYVNYTDKPIEAQAWFNLYYMDPADLVHKAGIYLTYKADFEIPVGAGVGANPDHVVGLTCPVPDTSATALPDGIHIYRLSSHMHRHGREFNAWKHDASTQTDIEPIYNSTNWASPKSVRFPDDDPLIILNGESIRYECSYFNDTGEIVREGQSVDDEMCMVTAGYYPAVEDGPIGLDGVAFCANGTLYY